MLNRIREALRLNESQWLGFKIGATAGLIFFIIYGAPNALIYGGYGAILLAGKIMGAPVEPAAVARIVIGVGMLMGLLSTALLFVVLGSLFGAGVGSIGNLISVKVKTVMDAAETPQTPATAVSKPVTGKAGGAAVKIKRWTKAGSFAGVVLFFIFGLVPGALYGGATGILLANRVFAMGEPSPYMLKALYFIGSVMGALGTITVFLVIGAVAGTLLGYAYNSAKEQLAAGTGIPGEMNEIRAKGE
jgi:hypothetical protein